MSTAQATDEDYKFFDFLAPYRWPNLSKQRIAHYRELVADGDLQIETMLENALAVASGKYKRVAEATHDLDDGSDAKKVVSQFRCNNIDQDKWMNSFRISNTKNKTGLLRILAYSKYQQKFYFFAIPNEAYVNLNILEIICDTSSGYREPKGIPKGKWNAYQVDSFKTLSTITEYEASKLAHKKMFGLWG